MIETAILRKRFALPSLGGKCGQTLVEYALILSVISIVALSTLMAMSGQVTSAYTTIDRQLNAAQNGGATTSARTH